MTTAPYCLIFLGSFTALTQLAAAQPNLDEMLSAARRLRAQSNYPDARKLIDEALRSMPRAGDEHRTAEALFESAGLNYNQGYFRDAIDEFDRVRKILDSAPDASLDARTLSALALVYETSGRPVDAFNSMRQALSKSAGLPAATRARVLEDAYLVYTRTGRYKHARDFAERQAGLAAQLDATSASHARVSLAHILYLERDLGAADRVLESAQADAQRASDPGAKAAVLLETGRVQWARSLYGEASRTLKEALGLYRAADDKSGQCETLEFVAVTDRDRGHFDAAERELREALSIRRAIGDSINEAFLLRGLARDVAQQKYELGQAELLFNQAIEIVRRIGHPRAEAQMLQDLSILQWIAGRNPEAAEGSRRALEVRKSVDDVWGQTHSMRQIAAIEVKWTSYQTQMDLYGQALAIARENGDRAQEIGLLRDIAGAHRSLGEFDAALDYYGQALELERKVGSPESIAYEEYERSQVFADQHNYQPALEAAANLTEVRRRCGNDAGVGWGLGLVGLQETNLGRLTDAVNHLSEAKSILERFGAKSGVAWILSLLSDVEKTNRNFDKARSLLDQELAMRVEARDASGEMACLNRIGLLLGRRNLFDKSREFYQRAQEIALRSRDRRWESTGWNNIAITWGDQGFNGQAVENLAKGIAIYHEFRDQAQEAFQLCNLAYYLRGANRDHEANTAVERALAIRRALHDRAGEADALERLAAGRERMRQYNAAIVLYQQSLAIWTDLKRGDMQASGLSYIANCYEDREDHTKALEFLNRALAIRKELKAPLEIASVLDRMAVIHDAQSDYDGSLPLYLESLDVRSHNNDLVGESIVLHRIGNTYNQRGEFPKALEYFQKSLDVTRKLENPFSTGDTLEEIADVYFSLGKVKSAIQTYNAALDIWKKQDNWDHQSIVFYRLGAICRSIGDYQRAIEYLKKAFDITVRHGTEEGTIDTLSELGAAYAATGEYDRALKLLQQSLEISRRLRNRRKQITSLGSLVDFYRNVGEYTEALAMSREAVVLARAIDDHAMLSQALVDEGSTYHLSGREERAIESLKQALSEAEFSEDSDLQRQSLNLMSDIYVSLQNFDSAETFLRKDLELSERDEDESGTAVTLMDLGNLARRRRQFGKAREQFLKALQLIRGEDDRDAELTCLGYLAASYLDERDYPRAHESYQKKLDLARRLGSVSAEAAAVRSLATVAEYQKNYAEANRQYRQALELFRGLKDRSSESDTLRDLATMLIDHSDPDGGIALLNERLRIGERIGDPMRESNTFYNLARAWDQKGDRSRALDCYRQALAKREELRGQARHSDVESGLAGGAGAIYGGAVGLLSRMRPEDGYEAFEIVERSRARAVFDRLGSRAAEPAPDVPPQAQAREKQLRLELTALEVSIEQTASLPESKPRVEQIEHLKQEHANKLREHDLVLKEVGFYHPDAMPGASISRETLNGIINRLDPSLTVIEYFMGADRVIAFAINRGKVKCFRLAPTPPELSTKIEELLPLPDPITSVQTAALAELYNWLIQPLKHELRGGTIGFVPHGSLHKLPFAALRSGRSDLLDEHQIFIAPSVMALPRLMAKRKAWDGTIAILAQPGPPGHFYLPGAQSEAKSIAGLFQTRADLDATDADFRKQAPAARIIHIAAHTDVDAEHPGASKILMNNPAGAGGFVYLDDIFEMRLPRADLVVLSACETLKGPVKPGDDLLAFNTAFLAAGAPSVLASLWGVDDKSTQLLMTEFYGHLRNHLPKVKALRLAQLAVRKKYPNPRAWAAFELTGDPGPVDSGSFCGHPLSWGLTIAAGLLIMSSAVVLLWRFKYRAPSVVRGAAGAA